MIHVRGLSLQSDHIDPYINVHRMEEFAEALINGETPATAVPQFYLSVFDGQRHVQTCYSVKRFRSPTVSKRVILSGSLYDMVQTMPYGYTHDLLNTIKTRFAC